MAFPPPPPGYRHRVQQEGCGPLALIVVVALAFGSWLLVAAIGFVLGLL